MIATIKSLFDWGRRQLIEQASTELNADELSRDATIEARFLLCHVLAKSSTYLLTWPEQGVEASRVRQFQEAIAQRIAGKPIAYITGYRQFWNLTLKVSNATLIPRADTEILLEQALALWPNPPSSILDLGTGTGAIALALASEFPQAKVIGSDRVAEAIDLAKTNALLNHIDNAQFIHGHWFEPFVGQSFDLIVSNPPYIDPLDPHLQQGDVRYEPSSALVSDNAGLADLEILIANASTFLNENGWLLLEHGYEQAATLRALFAQAAYVDVQTVKDYGDNERVTFGRKG